MRLRILLLWILGAVAPAAVFGGEEADFARALEEGGFLSLALKHYEAADSKGEIAEKDKDGLYLKMYQLYSQQAARAKDSAVQQTLQQAAERFYAKIKDKNSAALQLERVKSRLEFLRQASNQLVGAPAAEQARLKEVGRKEFREFMEVVDKIRKDVQKWFDGFDENDEKAPPAKKAEAKQMRELQVNVNLDFAEACSLYATIEGPADGDAKKWLLQLAETLEDFQREYAESPAGIRAGIYIGEANILLGNYVTTWKEKRNGFELGVMAFKEAILSLKAMKNYTQWRDSQLEFAYFKQVLVLEAVGEHARVVEAADAMLEWRNPEKVDPAKEKALHAKLMAVLEKKCLHLLELHQKNNDRKAATQLAEAASWGKRVAEKWGSSWRTNFNNILKKLPPGIDLTADVALLRADEAYREGSAKISEGGAAAMSQALPALTRAADLYLKAITLSAKEDRKKFESVAPAAYYKMASCFYKTDNLLLALAACLKAIDHFPSAKYTEKDEPETYKWILSSAKLTKNAALMMYKKSKQPFEKGMYRAALRLMGRSFPEEGGDPAFFEGELEKEGDNFATAIENYKKVKPDSDLYAMALFNIADCGYRKLRKDEEELKKAGKESKPGSEEFVKSREELLERFLDVKKELAKEFKRPQGMDDAKLENQLKKRGQALDSATDRLAKLYEDLGRFENAVALQEEIGNRHEGGPEGRARALQRIAQIHYNMGNLEGLDKDIVRIEKFPAESRTPQAEETLKDALEDAYRRRYNLLVAKVANPLKQELTKAKGAELEAKERKLAETYIEMARSFERVLEISGRKDEDMLKNAMTYYFNYSTDSGKATELLQRYFEWFPDKPPLEGWYLELMGKTAEDWDRKLGGNLASVTKLREDYLSLLDALFDKSDYSKMSLEEVRDTVRKTKDVPRNYQRARETLERMAQNLDSDIVFKKQAWPGLARLRTEVQRAEQYYLLRYYLGQCHKRQKQYAQAAAIYEELSHYFVEYHDIRIELANAAALSGKKEDLAKAKQEFATLLRVVPDPRSSSYKPIDYYSLWLGYIKADLELLGPKPDPCDVATLWKKMRSALHLDLSYFAKDAARFQKLGFASGGRAENEIFIADVRDFYEQRVFPFFKNCKKEAEAGGLAEETWTRLVSAGATEAAQGENRDKAQPAQQPGAVAGAEPHEAKVAPPTEEKAREVAK